jgi:signal transduction histidine kinase
MSQPAASRVSDSSAQASTAAETHLRGRWLFVARAIWLLLAAWTLASVLVGIPAYHAQQQTICTTNLTDCAFNDLPTPANVQALHRLGLSLDVYAAVSTCIVMAVTLVFLAVGALIFWRKSDKWIGMLTSLILLTGGNIGSAAPNVFVTSGPLYLPYQLFLRLVVFAFIIAVAVFLLTFPTGRFAPRWTWAVVLLVVILFVSFQVPPPYNVSDWPGPLFAAELLLTYGSAIAVQVYRYRRVYTPLQRQQTKWLVFGVAVGLVTVVLSIVAGSLVPGLNTPDSPYQLLNSFFIDVFRVTIPLSVGIALLRYRLWDIDLLISRALVYGGLTAGVIGFYVLLVSYLGALLRVGETPAISLLVTGLVAVLFQPVRAWLQRGVNWLMYGEREDPYAVLARLGQRLEGTLAPEMVLPTIVETIAQTLKLPSVAIVLTTSQQSSGAILDGQSASVANEMTEIAAAYGTPHPQPVKLPLVYQQEVVGSLLLGARAGETLGSADLRLLADLARQAGVAAYALRLTTDLQRLTVDLQQARERLVTAREEERRRLRRDLHDGLGPALASLTFKVDAARNLLRRDPERAETVLLGVTTQVREAIADIRRLVYALRPPALDELGLVPAVCEQVAQHADQGVQIDVDAPECLPSLPAAVEVAAYRIAQEALTNVLRHAHARHCTVCIQVESGALCLEVADDGQGLAVHHRIGIGVQTMHERTAELGGTCTISPGPTGGTVVRARLPMLQEPVLQTTVVGVRAQEG